MKKISRVLGVLFLVLKFSSVHAQTWTTQQILEANTAKDVTYLTDVEKECVMYINLCRLYPKDFLKNEVSTYYGTEKYGDYVKDSEYRTSLMLLLKSMEPVKALYFDMDAYANANCFAKEQGKAGTTGHVRINCNKGNYAECCSYGMHTGKDIAMQFLIEHNVPGLGHRKNCLNVKYTKIGVSVNPHTKYDVCAVVDMIW